MSLLSHPANNLNFTGSLLTNSPNLVEVSQGSHFKPTPNHIPYYPHHIQNVTTVHDNLGLIPVDINSTPVVARDQMKQIQDWNRINAPHSPHTHANGDDYRNDALKVPRTNSPSTVVYPWMKRIHVTHGKSLLLDCKLSTLCIPWLFIISLFLIFQFSFRMKLIGFHAINFLRFSLRKNNRSFLLGVIFG